MRRFAEIFMAIMLVAVALILFERLYPRAVIAPSGDVSSLLRRAKIVFVGDVMAHTPQLNAARRAGGYDFSDVFKYVKPIFGAADLVVANLETTLATTPPYSGYPLFRTPAELARAAADAGVDVMATANNHSLDAGAEGVRSTLRILDEYGIGHTGTSATSERCAPYQTECGGIRIALLNYTYGTNGIAVPKDVSVNVLDTVAITADIARCVDSEVKICLLHWGVEYSRRPSVEQRRISQFLNRHGVSVVVGSHPHVVQPTECTAEGVTIYSLGNFVSNQSDRYADGGIIAEVDIVEVESGEFEYFLNVVPVWVHRPDYAVLPVCVGDTLKMSEQQRVSYSRFMSDTQTLFQNM